MGVSCSEAKNKDEVNTQLWASLVAQVVKQCGRPGFNPWVRKIPWRRKWQPTPVFLPGKFHGWRSLVGYSPWGGRVRHALVNTQKKEQRDTKKWIVVTPDEPLGQACEGYIAVHYTRVCKLVNFKTSLAHLAQCEMRVWFDSSPFISRNLSYDTHSP